MLGALVAGVFFIIGGVVGFAVSRLLSSDAIKEILYKERLQLYKQLAFRFWELIGTCYESIESRDFDELEEKIIHLQYFLQNQRLLIPEALYEDCIQFLKEVRRLERGGDDRSARRKIEPLYRRWQDIAADMREQLGIRKGEGRVTAVEGLEWYKRSVTGESQDIAHY